jgi:hypothetical protein
MEQLFLEMNNRKEYKGSNFPLSFSRMARELN